MSYVVVGCDVNNGNDHKVQDTVANALKKQGHEVEKLAIAPGPFANYDWAKNGKNPKGKIGVYIIADGIFSIADRFANNAGFKYVYFVIRGDLGRPRMKNRHDFENNPIGADSDCTGVCEKIRGKTYPQINQIVKSKCLVVFGTTADEMANELIKAMGGSATDGKEDSKSGSGSGGNVRDCIQKLLKHWDGDVECRIQGKNVYINKVRDPEKYYSCALTEGVNIYAGNTTVSDINPDTPNHLVVTWTGGTIEFKDEKLMARFGEKLKEIEAVKKVVTVVVEKADDDSDSEEGTDEEGTDTNTDGDTGTT